MGRPVGEDALRALSELLADFDEPDIPRNVAVVASLGAVERTRGVLAAEKYEYAVVDLDEPGSA